MWPILLSQCLLLLHLRRRACVEALFVFRFAWRGRSATKRSSIINFISQSPGSEAEVLSNSHSGNTSVNNPSNESSNQMVRNATHTNIFMSSTTHASGDMTSKTELLALRHYRRRRHHHRSLREWRGIVSCPHHLTLVINRSLSRSQVPHSLNLCINPLNPFGLACMYSVLWYVRPLSCASYPVSQP